jgi:hypothetical protein
MGGEHQTHDYYMTIGPTFADPIARQLYAAIASVEEQHVTQYESIIDAHETWLEKWLLPEATEVYNYYSCVEYENNARIKRTWARFLEYGLGHPRVAVGHRSGRLHRMCMRRGRPQEATEARPHPDEQETL